MGVLEVVDAGRDFDYAWPQGDEERYDQWIDYRVWLPDGEQVFRVGFGERPVYGQIRKRVVVWLGAAAQAEFLGADDFEYTGDLLCEVKVPGDVGERICRYPDEAVPERYAAFRLVDLKARVSGSGVHGAWAVVANIANHEVLCAIAALRRQERLR